MQRKITTLGEYGVWVPEFAIPVFAIPTILVLLIVTYHVYYNTPNLATMSLDSAATSYLFNGKLISSDRENTLKFIPVDKIYDNTDIHISSSNLPEATSNEKITFDNIRFNGNVSLALSNISTSTGPREVNVTITSNNPGLYHGTIQITTMQITDANNKSFVPIIVTVKPNLIKVLIWVIDGIVLSVGTWNVIGYLFLNRQTEQTKSALKGYIDSLYRSWNQNTYDQIRITTIKHSLNSVITKLENSEIDSAKRELEMLRIIYSDVTKTLRMTSLSTQIRYPQDYARLRTRIENIKFSLVKYGQQPYVVEKNVISGLITIIFGLVVGFIALLQSDYINNLRVILPADATVLFLIGVGIGNLNEGIGKIWDRGKNGG